MMTRLLMGNARAIAEHIDYFAKWVSEYRVLVLLHWTLVGKARRLGAKNLHYSVVWLFKHGMPRSKLKLGTSIMGPQTD